MEIDVPESTLTLFLKHLYGSKVNLEDETIQLPTMMGLHSLALQFEHEELREAVLRRFRYLLSQEAWQPIHTVKLRDMFIKHKMDEIIHLVKGVLINR